VDRLGASLSHRIVAVSQHTADHMTAVERIDPGKISVIHNGIDFDRVRPGSPEAVAAIRREWAPAGGHLVVTAARLHPEKGYPQLFEAVEAVRRHLPGRLTLLVLGEGPFRAEFEARVKALNLESTVRFLGFRRDVHDFVAAADVFVLASLAEAFGLILAETLFLGTPVVATRAGGIPEIVRDGVDGLLVPPGDPAALGTALVRVLSDQALRGRLTGAGRARIQRDFGFDRLMQRYEELYEAVP
jgi:glycosyltransferase involved in cell wall biosynthesis